MGSVEEVISTHIKSHKVLPTPHLSLTTLPQSLQEKLKELGNEYLSDDVAETIMRVASRPPLVEGGFPHHIGQDGKTYVYEPSEWWTSGFFPGSIWLLYERSVQVPTPIASSDILAAALQWQKGMEKEQYNTETHDLGFMIMPEFYSHYKQSGSADSRDIVINAAKSLSSRWNEKVQCFRSWDECVSTRFNFTDKEEDFLVIIDNMMNLDLLYIGSELTGDPEFARRATAHAKTTLLHHIRPDNSTYHLVNYDAATGAVKGRYTVQGYGDETAWSRGQAWALYGYATAYRFTNDPEFLDASVRLSEYFCRRVEEAAAETGEAGAVYWDFDAPRPPYLLDTSAAMIACSGMLLLYQLTGDAQFLPTVTRIMSHCARKAKAPAGSDSILGHATVNNNGDAINPVRDTGLVYADYYFLEVGNRLIDLGFKR
ncbi:Unsaturated glucuronyl hydrolase [Cladobotryum mycophilum]|uniref:Unsaturated glucuronyl hydrolase n=1 Tax=Cladobotryum mycophilum TaxID=491253 RepID=A0ABR0STF5_9HYPO